MLVEINVKISKLYEGVNKFITCMCFSYLFDTLNIRDNFDEKKKIVHK